MALVSMALAAGAWLALVAWRPTTTWHLAPALVAGAGAWLAAHDRCGTAPHQKWWIGLIATMGLAVAWGEVEVFQGNGRLAGPALFGANVVVESMVTAALSSALAAYFGIRLGVRTRIDDTGLDAVSG